MGLLPIMIIKRLIIILFKTIITIIMLIYQLEFCHSNSLNSTISNQQHKHHHHHNHHQQQQQQNQDIIPYFTKPIENSTTVLGRNALLECSVENLGPYKVAWLKMDSSNSEPTVLTIGLDTLFGERKYRVTQNSDRQWFLHIKHVRISDRGNYMCQVNAKNMISQVGHLDVQVPPILNEERTSSDTTVDEHQKAVLKCSAKGYPKPKISWRREDGQPINLGLFGGQKYSVQTFEGSQLNLTQVTRDDMGAYLCIASNGVQPSISRRVLLHVNFRPKIRVQNQLISSRVGSRIQLVCMCEAYPRPIAIWITPTDIPIIANPSTQQSATTTIISIGNRSLLSNLTETIKNINNKKYEANEEYHGFRTTMRLIINYLTIEDFGTFKCLAKNSLGEKEGLIRVYEKTEIQSPTQHEQNLLINRYKNSANHGRKHSSNHTDDADDDDDDDDFGYDNENLLYDKPNQSLTSADNNHIINGKLIFVNFLLSTILLLR
uniref:Protein amalgam-like n=1 Tax=Dermatophagoides pteronyssinus TaxID=6956 RepID=A0A6P6XLF4_DERPT|nr:protein amalgam-like [Dermatophagoides pteronyssinus]